MFFIYIDESGTPGYDPLQHFFVLAAIVIKVEKCRLVQEKLQQLKHEYSLGDVEIKGRDIAQKKKIFKHITSESREGFVKRLFELLLAHNLSLFSVVFSKEEETIRRLHMAPEDVYHYAYKRLLNHLEEFLKSEDDNGMLLIDSRASSIRSALKDDRLIRFHQTCLDEFTRQGRQTRIVEYPVFVQSEFFAAVQLADLCAYNIFHALQIHFGQPFLHALQSGQTTYMPPIDHTQFQDDEFLGVLFSHPDIHLPILAKILKRRGRIDKLP